MVIVLRVSNETRLTFLRRSEVIYAAGPFLRDAIRPTVQTTKLIAFLLENKIFKNRLMLLLDLNMKNFISCRGHVN